ncbi:hypothetical protein FA13DRAFT_1787404 [Coprinellus micaceus]|uniref:Uncharacterized protein n=1 Tax=Coprinellus micaceus TaxID=71717 RepID=A0A4Y7TPR8_COPMI|nr:hypothetical protein FA13DRAFT_1787404 [Coprinellus micaceus]
MVAVQLYPSSTTQPFQKLDAILAMNAFVPGTRVFFWTAEGQVVYATVTSVSQSSGTCMLHLRTDDGRDLSLPAAGVSHVQ